MKNFTSIITAIAFAGIISFVSCSKDRIEPNEDLNSYESMDEYLDSKKQAEQEYEITEEGSEPLQGQQGTKIWIGKDLLMFPDSSDVEWPFTIRLVELYTPKDMIYYQMPSVAGQNMLETEGEIRVRAFKVDQNGVEQELLLKPGRVFAIEMPAIASEITYRFIMDIPINRDPIGLPTFRVWAEIMHRSYLLLLLQGTLPQLVS